jgi:hypothetical protein
MGKSYFKKREQLKSFLLVDLVIKLVYNQIDNYYFLYHVYTLFHLLILLKMGNSLSKVKNSYKKS